MKKDFLFAAAVLVAALVSGLFFLYKNGKEEKKEGVLEITIDGALYGTYSLTEARQIVVNSSYGSNTVVIEQGMAYVTQADCPDKICAQMPQISQEGESICCLPHRLFLTVK